MWKRALAAVAAATCVAGLAACSSGSSNAGGSTKVVAAFYPLAYAAQAIGGSAVSVTNLTPVGVEPHDLELSPAQVAQISDADVIVYIPGFMPALDAAIASQAPDKAIDASKGLESIPGDPHIWLDPNLMAGIGDRIATGLNAAAPQSQAQFSSNSKAFTTKMTELSDEYSTGLATCKSRDLVTSHRAFGYLAAAYNLDQIAIEGLSPDAEPSPARLREVTDIVKANKIKTIYYETLVDPKVAQTLADEAGVDTAVLDPIEGLVAGSTATYESLMRGNLLTLIDGQVCS